MKKTPLVQLFFLLLLNAFVFQSCKKEIQSKEADYINNRVAASRDILLSSGSCYETLQPDWFDDSAQTPTILGAHLLNNPYSVAVMQQASQNLYGNSNGISINKKYVRFKPADEIQLTQLVNLDIELYDYPLDYEVIQEGDFYDQGLPENEIPWFYTVVDPSFTPPPGIQYELLADLYVPDDDIFLENEAFLITGNPVASLDCDTSSAAKIITPDVPDCGEDSHWDYGLRECVPNDCPSGYVWDGSQCVDYIPPPPPPPPASKQPSGQILVFDNIRGGTGTNVPVRQAGIVLKRFLKIDRVYTNDNGNFSSNKHFHNKVNIIVKFKNDNIKIRGLRGVRFYQMFFPIKHGIGKFSGNLNNLEYIFVEDPDHKNRTYRNWWAAQLLNAYLEYNTMATALGTGTLPNNLTVLLTNWGGAGGAGSTPMNNHRSNNATAPRQWTEYFLVSPLSSQAANLINYLVQGYFLSQMDMTLGYNVTNSRTSDQLKALMYHEMSHAAHSQKVGQVWWGNLVFSETLTVVKWGETNDPYGDGTDGIASEYISVAESWAEHLARIMCDLQYGVDSRPVTKQGFTYFNGGAPDPTLSSHLNALEAFDRNRPVADDPFRWIPEGIYYDLFDVRADNFPIVDGVNGYTNLQMFNALDADVTSMTQYRSRLLQENGNNQSAQVIALFNQYHYL